MTDQHDDFDFDGFLTWLDYQDCYIDDEIRGAVPLPGAAQAVALERDMIENGLRSPIVVWQEERAVLDGVSRLAVCYAHDIVPRYEYVSLPSREAAILYRARGALTGRNLTAWERAWIAWQHVAPALQKAAKERQGARNDIGEIDATQYKTTSSNLSANLRSGSESRGEAQKVSHTLAEISGLGARSLEHAKHVFDHADEEFVAELLYSDDPPSIWAGWKAWKARASQDYQATVERNRLPNPKVYGKALTRTRERVQKWVQTIRAGKLELSAREKATRRQQQIALVRAVAESHELLDGSPEDLVKAILTAAGEELIELDGLEGWA